MRYILPVINFLLILIAVTLSVITLLDRFLMQNCLSYSGYYLTLILVFLWVVTLLQCLRYYKPSLKDFFRSYGPGILASLILCVIIFVSVKPMFRVLSDETNLMADSKSMLYERRVDNTTTGKWYYDNFNPIRREIPKRPMVFPFLTHLLHVIFGYHPENVFILNFLVLFALFSFIYVIIKSHFGNIWAFPAVLLVASQPIVVQGATCGGFDLLSAFFLIVCFVCLKWFISAPSAMKFQLLWITLIMHANIRYEGIAVFVIVMPLLAVFRYIKLDFFRTKMNFIYFCTPLLMLTTFWQRVLVKNPFEVSSGVAPISFSSFIGNNLIFLKSLIDYRFFLPYATIIDNIGIIALIYFGFQELSKWRIEKVYRKHLVIISVICVLVYWVMYTSFCFGRIDHPTMSRYYTFFYILLSIFAVMLATRIKIFRQKPEYILILSIAAFILYHPVSVQDRFSRTQTLPRQYRFVMNFLKKVEQNNRNFMIIAERPGMYTAWNYGAVNFAFANQQRWIGEEYNRHLYENIFVVQEIEYATGQPKKEDGLDSRYVLAKVAELQGRGDNFTRISRVTAIRENKPKIPQTPKQAPQQDNKTDVEHKSLVTMSGKN
jgi:hypothetical protein